MKFGEEFMNGQHCLYVMDINQDKVSTKKTKSKVSCGDESIDMMLPIEYCYKFDTTKETDWRCIYRTHVRKLCYILDNGFLSDVTLVSEDGAHIKAHRLLLSAHSPVYSTMFYGSFPKNEIVKEETTAEVLQWIVRYTYKGVFTLPSVPCAIEIYIFAHLKQMNFVVEICSAYLLSNLKSENVSKILELSTLYDDEPLKKECSKIIFAKQDSLFLTDEISKISRHSFHELLVSGHFKYTEKVLFRTILKWASAQIEAREEPMSPSALRAEAQTLLPLVDFTAMSSEYFIREVLPSKLFTPQEGISILQRQRDQCHPLPEILSGEAPLRRIRLQNENSSLYRIELNSKPFSCNYTFLYNYNNEIYSEKILVITSSERIFLSSVRVKSACYTGSWQLRITDKSDRQVGTMSSEGPPWNFDRMVPLSPDTTYIGKVCGRGKFVKHSIREYNCSMHTVTFSGMGIACKLGIVYWI